MVIAFEDCADAVVVHVAGEIDIASTPEFVSRLASLHRDAYQGRHVVLDLAGVTFFGSSGIAALAIFGTECATNAIELRVVPTRMIKEVLSITGADQIVDLAKTVDDALASLRRTESGAPRSG